MESHVITFKDTNNESVLETCSEVNITKRLSLLTLEKIFEINAQAKIITTNFHDNSKEVGTFVCVLTDDTEAKTYITKEEEVLGYIWNGRVNVLEHLFTLSAKPFIVVSENVEADQDKDVMQELEILINELSKTKTTEVNSDQIISINHQTQANKSVLDEESKSKTKDMISYDVTESTIDWINHKTKYGAILEQIQEQLACANEKIRQMELREERRHQVLEIEKNFPIKSMPKTVREKVSTSKMTLIPSEVLRFDRNKLKTKEERDRLLKKRNKYTLIKE